VIFRNRRKDPKGLIPIGMGCLVIAILWPWFLHPTTKFWKDAMEGLRGMLFEVSMVINLWSFKRAARQRRCSAN
jgi:hypothetical protein